MSSVACSAAGWLGSVLFDTHGLARRGGTQLVGVELDVEISVVQRVQRIFGLFLGGFVGRFLGATSGANDSVSVGTTPVDAPKSSSSGSSIGTACDTIGDGGDDRCRRRYRRGRGNRRLSAERADAVDQLMRRRDCARRD